MNIFDTPNYPTSHPLYSETNKKVIGKFKNNSGGYKTLEFGGNRGK